MSHLPDHLGQLTFFLTRPAPCPYLQGQVEQKIFTRLSGDTKSDFFLNSSMNQHGFRRSQEMIYRPACPACMACVPVRINVAAFVPDRRLRRIARKNADLKSDFLPVAAAAKFHSLFDRYQQTRHGDSDMAAMNRSEFLSMMQDGGENASLLTLTDGEEKVIGVMLLDRLHNGVSAVYSYYEPTHEKRSLGSELILRLVNEALAQSLPYVYLGYWIRDSRKMSYKGSFPSLERLGPNGWEAFQP
jgi:arginine-tRNA-protein transferase